MKLSLAIVGLPNVGKSTLFNALTKQEVLAANYPFATIDPNVGIVPVPDERLEQLAKLSGSKKVIPAVIEFYDIAGLVKGAHKGEGLGNQFLSHIRETDAIVLVLRCFGDENVIHVDGSVDPVRDLGVLESELVLKDLEIVEKRLERVSKDARSGDKELQKEKGLLEQVRNILNDEELLYPRLRELGLLEEAIPFNLLSAKPQIVLLNGKGEDVSADLRAKIEERGASFVVADLSSGAGVPELVGKSYEILDLISFFTTGEKETRAWTIRRGAKAPQAAGVIHSDFEEKFIRAEVVGTKKLLEAGSWSAAKGRGWIRVEGKEHVVEDGDVVLVRHG
jgi:ribosome-binding ATPase